MLNPIELKMKIADYRKWLRLGQFSVAKYLGISKSAMSALESDPERRIELHELVKLCKLFMCTPDEILGFDSVNSENKTLQFTGRMSISDSTNEIDKKELISFVNELERQAREPGYDFIESATAKSTAPRSAVEELLVKYKIKEAPIDVYQVAIDLGINVKFSALSNLSGAFVRGKEGKKASGILLNSNQPEGRLRFSLAHEIAHFYLNHYEDRDLEGTSLGRQTLMTEKDADSFASDLLIPPSFLRNDLEKIASRKFDEIEIYKLADKYIVSYQAMLNKLYYQEKYITSDQFDRYSKLKVSEIKKQIESTSKAEIKFDRESHFLPLIENNSNFNISKINKDKIRLLQEIAFEKYQQEVPLEERGSEVKEVYENVVLWLSDLKDKKLNEKEETTKTIDLVSFFETKRFEVHDKRNNGGCLWIVEAPGLKEHISQLEKSGYKFLYTKNGSRTTSKRPSWYLIN
jgi:Zn-dependent peptidase ImmA (M78 family)/DNA-binding Xre family transcriptional regulator